MLIIVYCKLQCTILKIKFKLICMYDLCWEICRLSHLCHLELTFFDKWNMVVLDAGVDAKKSNILPEVATLRPVLEVGFR